jgi:hypothetical protein
MLIVYIAGPFRSINDDGTMNSWGIQKNVMAAMERSLEVWKRGHVGLCVHANTMFFQNADGCMDSVWLDGDIELLKRSDALLTTDRWDQSSGARAEVEYARSHRIPVLHTIDQLDDFIKARTRDL